MFSFYREILGAIRLSVLLKELPRDLLPADVTLEARLVVDLSEGSAAVLLDGLVAGPALPDALLNHLGGTVPYLGQDGGIAQLGVSGD